MDYFRGLAIHIGSRLRFRRRMLHLTPKEVADRAGITVKELRAYERGQVKVHFHCLMRIAEAIEVDVFYFYNEMPEDLRVEHARRLAS